MKRILLAVVLSSAVCLLLAGDLVGRGGGGGGRGGGGGGGGGGRVGGGTPVGGFGDRGGGGAVARPAAPVRPSVGTGAVGKGTVGKGVDTRPDKGQLQDFLDVPRPSTPVADRPGVRPAGPSQGAVSDFLSTRPAAGTGVGVGKPVVGKPGVGKLPGERPLAQNRPERVQNRQQLQDQRRDRRNEIRDEFRDNHPRFDWALDHPRWAAWRINRPYRWATLAALTGWVGYGSPSYYDYGDNIYYADDAVYSDGEQIATADQYAAAAEQIATGIPAVKNPDWMPLGVFAITQDGQASGPAPTMFVQLAVSKEGIISGTFQNTTAGTPQPIEGMVDKNSQRAAWVISGKTRPIMETGIFNLSKDTAPALIHFADGQAQQWLLVRLDEPKE